MILSENVFCFTLAEGFSLDGGLEGEAIRHFTHLLDRLLVIQTRADIRVRIRPIVMRIRVRHAAIRVRVVIAAIDHTVY